MPTEAETYDVAIIGGAFSGSAAGILLKRARPDLRILIVEKSVEFDRKVGESTSEVAACFLTKILHLDSYLSRHHIAKQGLRMWFNGGGNESLDVCSEIGSFYQVRLPAYQLDRSRLDSHLLGVAAEEGCEVWRPATLRNVGLEGIGKNVLEVRGEDGSTRTVRARWVIDASGKAAFLARKLGHWRALDEHPTNAVWARFRKVGDLDGHVIRSKYPEFAKAVHCSRAQATNHLMGRGWWCWIIPLRDGDVSAGLTYDPRLFQLPEEGTLTEKLVAHLLSHPVGRALFENAEPVEKDTRTYSRLPYYSARAMGEGWASVGDAAGFMDPLYSQGLDYCAHTVFATHKIILRSLGGECVQEAIEDYSEQFRTSYFRWYRALYQDKYKYLGDMELMAAAFLLDVGTYFLGPVRLVHEKPDDEFARLPYFGPAGRVFAAFMRFYNHRLARIADKRAQHGLYGAMNLGERFLVRDGFTPSLKALSLIRRGVWWWLRGEWRSAFLPARPKAGSPKAVPVEAGRETKAVAISK